MLQTRFVEPSWAPSIDLQQKCTREKKPAVCVYFARHRWCRCVWANNYTFAAPADETWCQGRVKRPSARILVRLAQRAKKHGSFGGDPAGWELECGPALRRGQLEVPPLPVFSSSRLLPPTVLARPAGLDGGGPPAPCTEPKLRSSAFTAFDLVLAITTPSRAARVRRIGHELCMNLTLVQAYPKPTTPDEWAHVAALGEPTQRLTAGEVAVRLSMRRANELFLSHPTATTALIFEDDFSASGPALDRRLSASLAALPTRWDMLFLGRCYGDCAGEHMGGDLYRTFESLCLHAYVVTRAGSAALLNALANCTTKVCPADSAASNVAWERGRSFAVWPQLFAQSLGLRMNGSATLASTADKVRPDSATPRTARPLRLQPIRNGDISALDICTTQVRGVSNTISNKVRPPYLAECARKHARRIARSSVVPSWSSRSLRSAEQWNDMVPLLARGAALALRQASRCGPVGAKEAKITTSALVAAAEMVAKGVASCQVSACMQALSVGHPLWHDVTNLQRDRAQLDAVDMQMEACALQTAAVERGYAAMPAAAHPHGGVAKGADAARRGRQRDFLRGRTRTREAMRQHNCLHQAEIGNSGGAAPLQCPPGLQSAADAGASAALHLSSSSGMHALHCALLSAGFRQLSEGMSASGQGPNHPGHRDSDGRAAELELRDDDAPVIFDDARWPRPLGCTDLQERLALDGAGDSGGSGSSGGDETVHSDSAPAWQWRLVAAQPGPSTARSAQVLLPLPGAGDDFFDVFLPCWMPGAWERQPLGSNSSSPNHAEDEVLIAIVRDPLTRFIASMADMLRRGLAGQCGQTRCNDTDAYITDGQGTGTPWQTARALARQTSWYAPAAAALDDTAESGDAASMVVQGFVRDVTCGRRYYGSSRFAGQHALLHRATAARRGQRLEVVEYERLFPLGRCDGAGCLDGAALMRALGLHDDGSLRARARHCYAHAVSGTNATLPASLPTAAALGAALHGDAASQALLCAAWAADYGCFAYPVPNPCSWLLTLHEP